MSYEQLTLDLNIQPPVAEMLRYDSDLMRFQRQLMMRNADMVRRMIRNTRNEVHPGSLSTRLWNMSKGYSKMNRTTLVQTAIRMTWEIKNYKKTGKVTNG